MRTFWNRSIPPLTWQDLEWLQSLSPLPLVLKGILRGDDAVRAIEHGAQGIIVSNHGGRQLDGAIASIDALPEIVTAVAGRAEDTGGWWHSTRHRCPQGTGFRSQCRPGGPS